MTEINFPGDDEPIVTPDPGPRDPIIDVPGDEPRGVPTDPPVPVPGDDPLSFPEEEPAGDDRDGVPIELPSSHPTSGS
jgi:hypothetical protein